MDKEVFEIYMKEAEDAFLEMRKDPKNRNGSFEFFLVRWGAALASSEIAVVFSDTLETRENMGKVLNLFKVGIEFHKECLAKTVFSTS